MSREIFYISMACIYSLLNLITLIFSLIIILTIVLNWQTHFRSVANLLIFNSSFVFILYTFSCFIQIPFMFINQHRTKFCQLRAFFTIYTACTQILTYLSQAIFRYFSTIHYQRKILLTFRFNILIILSGWIIPLIFTASLLTSPYAYRYEPESRLCFLTTKYFSASVLLSISILLIPLTIIVVLYGLILWKITHSFQSNSINIMRYKRNLKVFHNILISIGIIIVCGTPFVISVFMNLFSKSPWIFYSIIILSISLAMSLESMVLFFTTKNVKEMFYAKIGCRRVEVQTKQLRRRDQILIIASQTKRYGIRAIHN